MDTPNNATEQSQIAVEIEAVLASIGQQDDPQRASYEVEQGRKLIEKARSLKLPEQSYAKLQDLVSTFDGKDGA